MTQQVVHARVLFHSTNSFMDNPSNDFTFEATGSNPNLVLDEVKDHIVDLYNNVPTGGTQAPAEYMAESIDRTAGMSQIIYYDVTAHLDGSRPGPPIRMDNWQLLHSTTSDLPPGAAAMCSYRAAYGSDTEHVGGTRPRARDRSRFYFGPLSQGAIQTNGGQLATLFRLNLIPALQDFFGTVNSGAANQFNAVVWSRRNAAVKQAEFVYVDEACTYQRRRADSTLNRVHSWIGV